MYNLSESSKAIQQDYSADYSAGSGNVENNRHLTIYLGASLQFLYECAYSNLADGGVAGPLQHTSVTPAASQRAVNILSHP